MKANNLIWIFLLTLPLGLFGQVDDFQNVAESFRQKLNEKKYSTEIKLRFYSSQQALNPIQTELISVQVYNNYLHYLAGSIEVFTSPDWVINIDHEQKTILINNAVRKKSPKFKQSEFVMLDSILLGYFDSKLIESRSGISKYRIAPKGFNKQINTAYFAINSDLLVPISIDIFYAVSFQELFGIVSPGKENLGVDLKGSPRLIMDYKGFTYQRAFDYKLFDFGKFVVFDGKSWELGYKAQQYKLIDYSTRKPSRS